MWLHTMASVRTESLLSELICSYAGPGDDREMNKLKDVTFVRTRDNGEMNANGLLIIFNISTFSCYLMMVE